MSLRRSIQNRPFGIFLLLALYLWQAVGVANIDHSAKPADADVSILVVKQGHEAPEHCHQPAKEHNLKVSAADQTLPGSCCDDGCDMVACHPVSVALNNAVFLPVFAVNHNGFQFSKNHLQRIPASLYRPPIIG